MDMSAGLQGSQRAGEPTDTICLREPGEEAGPSSEMMDGG